MTVDPHRIEHLARALSDEGAPLRECREYPASYKLRVESLHLLHCSVPLVNGRHGGNHRNRAGDVWAQARRPRPIELVEERRPASW